MLTGPWHPRGAGAGEFEVTKHEVEIVLLSRRTDHIADLWHVRNVRVLSDASHPLCKEPDSLELCQRAFVPFLVEAVERSRKGAFGRLRVVQMAVRHRFEPPAPRLPSTDRITTAPVLELEGST